ncbi:hypothetical protein amyaer_p04825 (plasmid) [Microcystis aeruginosa NIES-2481]|nr:hypothetical protein amyaer_p04825 [Microcystis aeruginosa NIES-2481]
MNPIDLKAVLPSVGCLCGEVSPHPSATKVLIAVSLSPPPVPPRGEAFSQQSYFNYGVKGGYFRKEIGFLKNF